MANDPLYNFEMPRWWDWLAYVWRGVCLGFLLGYLFAGWAPPSVESGVSILVVALSLALTALPSLPKAWIEQRNRLRALHNRTLTEQVDQGRNEK